MTPFAYHRPATLDEAVGLLMADEGGIRPLAGGTDLSVGIRHRHIRPRAVVDLKSIPALAPAIQHAEDCTAISALSVMTDLEEDERIAGRFPALVEAAAVVGSVQIRNRATLVGNLCNASPAADTPPVLIALGASVVVWGPRGERLLPMHDFIAGYRRTSLRAGELVTGVRIPVPRRRAGSKFLKLGRRRALEISVACAAASVELADDGTIAAAGIGVGSVAPCTMRARRAEEMLVGERPGPGLLAAAGEAALEVCSPIDDVRGSGEYRRAMLPVLVSRALAHAIRHAQGAR